MDNKAHNKMVRGIAKRAAAVRAEELAAWRQRRFEGRAPGAYARMVELHAAMVAEVPGGFTQQCVCGRWIAVSTLAFAHKCTACSG